MRVLIADMGFRQNVFLFLLAFLVTVVSACGGGDWEAIPPAPLFVESPSDGGFIEPQKTLEFAVTNTTPELAPDAVYSFELYNDEGMLEKLEAVEGYREDSTGTVRWTIDNIKKDADKSFEDYPYNITYDDSPYDNRAYWWRWSVTYMKDTGPVTEESPLLMVRVKRENYMQVASPRNDGYMDIRNTTSPRLAVWNLYTGDSSVDIKYDFELYSDEGMTGLLQSIEGVEQQSDEIYTAWSVDTNIDSPAALQFNTVSADPAVDAPTTEDPVVAEPLALELGATYYWRAREVIADVPGNWTDVYSFTVVDICEISGSIYAEHVTELTPARYCPNIEFTDVSQALGPPSAGGDGIPSDPYYGFLSIDIGGILGVEMGKTVYNGWGNDIRVYEYVTEEPIELFVANSEIGPWYSLGLRWCDPYCDWDLGASPLSYARYIRIKDSWPLPNSCHSTSGADIHAVEALNWVTDSVGQCGGY